MTSDMIKSKNIYIPQRAYGICIWLMPDGFPLSDGDGVLCAEGMVGDESIELRVAEAAKYWTGSPDGVIRWVPGARKVSSDERDDQAERLSDGLVADPFEDMYDEHFGRK